MSCSLPRQMLVVFFALWVVAPSVQALESLGFTDLNKRVEVLETQDVYKLSRNELVARFKELVDDVDEFIEDNPENPDILVLSARLGYLEERFVHDKNVGGFDIVIDPDTKFAKLHQRLDRAIELFPKYAAAYYWKAALYGMPASMEDSASGQVVQRPINLGKAIEFAARAVETEPGNGWYRRTLAMYHFSAGDNKAALAVLDTPEMASSPVRLLIKDMEMLPLPFGSIFSQEDTDGYIDFMMKQKTIKDYPNLRVRVFVVPLSIDELGDFFRGKWPNFEFFSQGGNDLYAQYMLPKGDGVRPSAHIGEARTWASQNMGGLVLSVQEVRNASAEQRKATPAGRPLPSNLGNNFCYLFMVNKRVVQTY